MEICNIKDKQNPFIEFYGKHGISPVHQDVRNFKVHLMRREKLYRLLGIPLVTFNDRTILEIGPGGGYNALAFFAWGAKVDFIEPNPTAREELPRLLCKYNVQKDRWRMFPCKVEDFNSDRQYDIVIAEGFIPGLYNRRKVINAISSLVKKGGVVVVTCLDDISFFFEFVKRIIAHRLLQEEKINEFSQKVKLLSRAFSSHFKSLKYRSRPLEDWVIDNFLNPFVYGDFFSIADCIREFDKDFILLGSSPSMFTDCSWYKNIEYNRHKLLLEQFSTKRHVLMLWDMDESVITADVNEAIVNEIRDLRQYVRKVETHIDKENVTYIIAKLKCVKYLAGDIDSRISTAIEEAINLLRDKRLTALKIARTGVLSRAFGRGQQYVSLAKKITIY